MQDIMRQAVERCIQEVLDALGARADRSELQRDLAQSIWNLIGSDCAHEIQNAISSRPGWIVRDLDIQLLGAEKVATAIKAGDGVDTAVRENLGFRFDSRFSRNMTDRLNPVKIRADHRKESQP